MSEPLIEPSDLAIYLNDPTIDQDRAYALIVDAQTLCETVISPLPDAASVIVKRVAARGYVTITSARQYQLGIADTAFGSAPGPVGGVYLTRADKADLRRAAGGGGAFTVDLLPTDYAPQLPPWDNGDQWDEGWGGWGGWA